MRACMRSNAQRGLQKYVGSCMCIGLANLSVTIRTVVDGSGSHARRRLGSEVRDSVHDSEKPALQ